MGDALAIWLYGRHVADLTEPSRYRYRLTFTDEALDIHGEGARVLSLAIPVQHRPVSDHRDRRPVSAFLEGLLPEGSLRQHVASALGVPSIDKMAILRQVGGECAGAVQFLPTSAVPDGGTVRRLSDVQVTQLVGDLPTYHLHAGDLPQASLAGIQEKVLLTRLADGAWGLPEGGAASTHLVKPEPQLAVAVPHLVEAEDWALRVAERAGLSAAESELTTFGDRLAIVVTRYDRSPDGRRTHQEDFCQALGLEPEAKYEGMAEFERHGSRLSRLVRLAADRTASPAQFRADLLRAVAFNVVIGNGDAHSKNYSLLIAGSGEVTLAPLYDTAPVMYLNPRFKGTGHVIAGRTNIDWVDVHDLVAEGVTWGMPRRQAESAVRSTLEQVHEAVAATDLPPGTENIRARMDALWAKRSWAVSG
ncbi:type II toxin-antitoxin system HipA family toxin [Nocardioides stalactiti]|uniref:type II toxin-antitoxin system HipA family toxin n=1 Tax=Nocardioides stalactiti TaxID=2755356 RepID=UPI001603DC24|nr:HipA domain-containing protein [Nocardioides stalactiti]